MANGDTASAQGFTPVAGTKDIRLGYDDINRLADWVASRTTGRRISASGTITVDVTGSGSTYTAMAVTVTLPAGRFTGIPTVVASILTGQVDAETFGLGIANRSATSFELNFKRSTNTSTGIQWIAMETG